VRNKENPIQIRGAVTVLLVDPARLSAVTNPLLNLKMIMTPLISNRDRTAKMAAVESMEVTTSFRASSHWSRGPIPPTNPVDRLGYPRSR
jgi:hypothetical protein